MRDDRNLVFNFIPMVFFSRCVVYLCVSDVLFYLRSIEKLIDITELIIKVM